MPIVDDSLPPFVQAINDKRQTTMTIREMTAREAWEYFRDLGQRGFLAIEGEEVVGWMGFNSDDRGLYVHSVFCTDEGHACASLVQAMIRLAKDLKVESIRYIVDENNPHFLRLVNCGRASVQSYIVNFPVRDGAQRGVSRSILP